MQPGFKSRESIAVRMEYRVLKNFPILVALFAVLVPTTASAECAIRFDLRNQSAMLTLTVDWIRSESRWSSASTGGQNFGWRVIGTGSDSTVLEPGQSVGYAYRARGVCGHKRQYRIVMRNSDGRSWTAEIESRERDIVYTYRERPVLPDNICPLAVNFANKGPNGVTVDLSTAKFRSDEGSWNSIGRSGLHVVPARGGNRIVLSRRNEGDELCGGAKWLRFDMSNGVTTYEKVVSIVRRGTPGATSVLVDVKP